MSNISVNCLLYNYKPASNGGMYTYGMYTYNSNKLMGVTKHQVKKEIILLKVKPNYFKKQLFSSSLSLTGSKYTGPKWPWSTQQASS